MQTVDIVSAVISHKHGWAVSEQFEETFNGDPFDGKNYNALRYIREEVEKLLKSNVLSESSMEDLQDYRDQLEDYMVAA